mmetsp:Transcript_26731/g.30601  ORF Transcript_26731/g.30601 Transcript_26731/m.30601 type:complete len:235 (+) Transcript_26731:233-937(+)
MPMSSTYWNNRIVFIVYLNLTLNHMNMSYVSSFLPSHISSTHHLNGKGNVLKGYLHSPQTCFSLLERQISSQKIELQMNRRSNNSDNESEEDDDFEYARVGRRRRSRYSNEDYNEDEKYARVGKSSQRDRSFVDDDDEDLYDEVEFDDDEDDEDYDDDDDFDSEYSDIIPNALLDQIDPDGAIDRLPELFSDPQFYRDAAIVFVFFIIYAFGRLDNPLYAIKDIDQIDFSQFYN